MKIKVLDDGFVRLVDRVGDDYSILRAARVSTGSNNVKEEKKDRGLIRYLYKNKHLTPFEQVVFTFHVRSPLFVNQQILRHRTFSFNQESSRYKKLEWKCHVPSEWRKQDTKNRQSSLEELDFNDAQQEITKDLLKIYNEAEEFYNKAIDLGITREQARIVLPMGQYTELYFTVDLRNLLHFIELRSDKYAQQEIQEYANALLDILKNISELKWTIEIFSDILKLERAIAKSIEKNDVEETIKKLE